MTKRTMTLSLILTVASILLTGGCKENAVDPPNTDTTIWKEVEQFRGVDIRYMTVYDGTLYVSAVRHSSGLEKYTNALLRTQDGKTWDTLKTFERWIGPVAFHGDTLTILEDARTWKYHPSFGWKMFWAHYMTANFARDMIWLNNRLFVFENAFKMGYTYGGEYNLIDSIYLVSVTRFIPFNYKGKEVGITRPFYVFKDGITMFDGASFMEIMDGVGGDENYLANYPSLLNHEGVLYAGFNSPSRIKKWLNERWINCSDTLPPAPHATDFHPNLLNRPTSVAIVRGKLFVGTEWTGVLVQTSSGWKNIASGLPLAFPDYPDNAMYLTVTQMQTFKNSLFVGYGEPWSAPVTGGRGLYVYTP